MHSGLIIYIFSFLEIGKQCKYNHHYYYKNKNKCIAFFRPTHNKVLAVKRFPVNIIPTQHEQSFIFSIFKVFIEATEGYRSVSNPVVIR